MNEWTSERRNEQTTNQHTNETNGFELHTNRECLDLLQTMQKLIGWICPRTRGRDHSAVSTGWQQKYSETNQLFFIRRGELLFAVDESLQKKREVQPMLADCWASVADGGSAANQHCINVSCLLGQSFQLFIMQSSMYTFSLANINIRKINLLVFKGETILTIVFMPNKSVDNSTFRPRFNKSSPWIWKGVSTVSRRYTLSYPRRRSTFACSTWHVAHIYTRWIHAI